MEIRFKAPLLVHYKEPQKGMKLDSAEILLMEAISTADYERAVHLFPEKKQFTGALPVVDMPYGRFEGLDGIRAFAEGFCKRFEAESFTVLPMFQTRAGGRSVTEMVVSFVRDGMIDQMPIFVVADLGARNTLEEVRMYTHCSYVPGLTAYRAPIFPSAHLEMGDPGLMTGAIKEYYTALHHMPSVDVDRIVGCMAPGCVFGGYEPYGSEIDENSHSDLRAIYGWMATYIPRKVAMRYETLIDDGVTGVIEWVHVISDQGRNDLDRIALSGIAAYQRGEDGRLIAIRISDYAGLEKTIDWSKTNTTREEAVKVNAVHEFPYGVGRKSQDIL